MGKGTIDNPISVDTIYVWEGDSLKIVINVDQQMDSIELTIKDERSQDGFNPFFSRKDTTKYPLHSIRKLIINSECDITDISVDSIYYNGIYFYISRSCHLKNDEIITRHWQNANGGVGVGALYKKGYHVSVSSRNGGYFIDKRTPDDTINIHLPIGEQIYEYLYDDQGRIDSIKHKKGNDLFYSVKYNSSGLWTKIKFKDLVIIRNR